MYLAASYLCHAEQFDRGFASMEHAFFSLNLLEHEVVGQLAEFMRQWRPSPLLVLFGVLLLEGLHILCHFLQCLLKLTGAWLARVKRIVGHPSGCLALVLAILELQLLCGAGRCLYIGARIRRLGESAFRRRSCYCTRHLCI